MVKYGGGRGECGRNLRKRQTNGMFRPMNGSLGVVNIDFFVLQSRTRSYDSPQSTKLLHLVSVMVSALPNHALRDIVMVTGMNLEL